MAEFEKEQRVRIRNFPMQGHHQDGTVVGVLPRADFSLLTVRLDGSHAEVMVSDSRLSHLTAEQGTLPGLTLEQQMNKILERPDDGLTQEERERLAKWKATRDEVQRRKEIIGTTWALFSRGYQRFGVDVWDENGDDYHYIVVWAKKIDEVRKWGDRFTHINQPSLLEVGNIGLDDVVILAEPLETTEEVRA